MTQEAITLLGARCGPRAHPSPELHAALGDSIVVRRPQVGEHEPGATILAVEGEDGAPCFLVRWDDAHESVFFPSSDTTVEHRPAWPSSS